MRCLVSLIALASLAQTPSEEFKISADVNRVLLAVSVKDPSGGFVSGLDEHNFVVYDDDRPQKIRYFSDDDVPVSVGLALDNSGSMRSKRAEANLAALQFIDASNPNDEMFVINFNDTATLGLPPGVEFSGDRNQLRLALDSARPAGKTALYDAIDLAIDQVQKGKYDKKAILVISDGGDNASHTAFDAVLEKARRSSAIIYTIAIYDEDDQDRNPRVLRRLASITGGEMCRPEMLSDIRRATAKIAHEIRTQYTLAFAPEDTVPGSYHRIRIVASAPGHGKLKVKTRQGYVAPSAGAQASEKQRSESTTDAAGSNPK